MICEYNLRAGVINKLLAETGSLSCVKDRNATNYHRGMVKGSEAFPDPNTKAAVIGALGEFAYTSYFDQVWKTPEHSVKGDGGFDLVVDGFTIDVKTRSRDVRPDTDDVAGYVRSVMGSGKRVSLSADYYFFACVVGEPSLSMVRLRLLGGIDRATLETYDDIVSPIRGCDHQNKVVRAKDLNVFGLVDLWN